MSTHYLKIFTQQNTAVLLLLGFASGLPLALTGGTLQAWMATLNIDLKTIGFFTLVGQAYVFKFLWSPLMDRFVPPILGRRRGWLIVTQLLLCLFIFAMGCINPVENLWLMAIFAVVVAFSSASQDIAFDAYRTDLLKPEERGTGAAVSTLGYRIAMLVSSGLAMWLAGTYLSWQQTYWLMAMLMLIGIIATLWAENPVEITTPPRTLQEAIVVPFKDFLGRNSAWIFLLLIIFYKMGDAFAGSLSTVFLLNKVGFTIKEIAEIHKTLGIFATLLGVMAGGVLMQRLSLFRALLLFGLLQAVSNFGYWLLVVTDKNIYTLASVIIFENLCGGMGTAAFVALLMTLCNKSFSATQYALLSALAAIGRVYVGPVSGWFVEIYGWSTFFLFSVAAALPGLLLLIICRQALEFIQTTSTFSRRSHDARFYHLATSLLFVAGCLLFLWIIFAVTHYYAGIHQFAVTNPVTQLLVSFNHDLLIQGAVLFAIVGMVLGATLDYLALRKEYFQIGK